MVERVELVFSFSSSPVKVLQQIVFEFAQSRTEIVFRFLCHGLHVKLKAVLSNSYANDETFKMVYLFLSLYDDHAFVKKIAMY